jgi:hypothetical protein
MFDFGHISTVPDASDIVFRYGENSLRVPRRCPHDDKCCEKAHNTFHMKWKCAHDSGFQAVCLKYWAKALRLILYLRDLGELLLSARAVNDTNK